MTYSVWDHANRVYVYYETPNKSDAINSPKPRHLRSSSVLGLAPEQAAWPLPSNARPVGKGKYPKGHIATKGGSSLGLLPDLTPTNMLLMGAFGFFVWKMVEKRR